MDSEVSFHDEQPTPNPNPTPNPTPKPSPKPKPHQVSFHDEQRLREAEAKGGGEGGEAGEGGEGGEGAKEEDQFLDVLTDFYNWASEWHDDFQKHLAQVSAP